MIQRGLMSTTPQVTANFFPESAFRYLDHDAIVCVDVLTTTTTLVTAVAEGWRVVLGGTAKASILKASNPITVGDAAEEGTVKKWPPRQWPGRPRSTPELARFDCPDSPVAVLARGDRDRPLQLASGVGLDLISNAYTGPSVYIASLRNMTATAAHVARAHRRVAVLGACTAGVLLCEDQIAVSRIAASLCEHGFEPGESGVSELIRRWSTAEISLGRLGASAEQLRRHGRQADVDFAFTHVDDLDLICRVEQGEIVSVERAAAVPRRIAGARPASVRASARTRATAASSIRRLR